jgi:hypothetical protein
VSRWYFTESCKKIKFFATITDGDTDGICPFGILPRVGKKFIGMCHHHRRIYWQNSLTDRLMTSPTDGAHSKACDCQTAWSVGTFLTDTTNPMRAWFDTQLSMDLPTGFEKSEGIFKILARKSIKYRWNLMPPSKKILFYYPLVFPSVKLQYKSAPPP